MKTKLSIYIICLILLYPIYSQAQVTPIQIQYLTNPYIYNPSFAGQSGFTTVNIGFRKQWWGIEGSPTIISSTFEHPLNENLSLAGQLINYSEGPINQLEFMGTVGYRIALDYAGEQFLSFGMSLGLRNYAFNINKLDNPNDPSLASIAENHLELDGAFGLSYQYKGLQVGVAAPHLTQSQYFTEGSLSDLEFKPWEQFIAMTSYEFYVDNLEEWKIKPQALFHYDQNFEHQWEGLLTLTYLNQFWAGASYRKSFGATVLAGAQINDNLSLNYGYNFSSAEGNIANDTHELSLRLQIGRKRRDTKTEAADIENDKANNTEDVISRSIGEESVQENPEVAQEANVPEVLRVDESISLDQYDESIDVYVKFDGARIFGRTLNRDIFDLQAGNYIFMKTYDYISDSREDYYALKYKGFNPRYVYDSSSKLYYLYLISKKDYDDARRITLKLRSLEPYKDAQLLILQE